jgi:hypothetical protein
MSIGPSESCIFKVTLGRGNSVRQLQEPSPCPGRLLGVSRFHSKHGGRRDLAVQTRLKRYFDYAKLTGR